MHAEKPSAGPAARLRMARLGAGWHSASEAARTHNWVVSSYIAHENGQNRFDVDQARLYAAAFGVSPGWLIMGIDQYGNPLYHIREELQRLPATTQAELLDIFARLIAMARHKHDLC